MSYDLNHLKEVLSVPTKTYKEDLMVRYICEWLEKNNIEYYLDDYSNVYATKGQIADGQYYPLVLCHTDTVHEIDVINIREQQLPNAQGETKLSLQAFNDNGQPTGIGGDDKCGVFACLTLLKEIPVLKAAFFVSEETGCHGSKKADKNFLQDVGYGIQFDAPENWMISEVCSGEILFDRQSEFFEKVDKVLSEGMVKSDMLYMNHPYTDVYALRNGFDFSCINFSIGYYNYHTKYEYVVVEDVFNGINMGKKMIKDLGCNLYYKKKNDTKRHNFVF